MGRLGELEPVPRKSTVEIVSDELRSAIMYGSLEPGAQLGEAELASRLGISRGPLREAIKRLSGQGYLTMETHRGAFVKAYTPQEIVDLYELRSALELYALRLVVERAGDDDLDALAVRLAEESERIRRHEADTSASEPYASELDFHQQLVALSGNQAIRAQLSDANHKLFLALRPTTRTETRKEHAVTSHVEILDRVRARDADASVELLSAHLADSMSNTLRVLGLSDRTDAQTQEGTK